MTGSLRGLVVRHLVSPYGIAIVPCCGFLFAWLFPPDVYTYYVREPDLMYRNPDALLFFVACAGAFLLGVRLVGQFASAASAVAVPKIQLRSGSPLLYLVAPLALAALPCFVYMTLIASSMNVFALILSQQGDLVKQAITGASSDGIWGSTLFLLTGVLWWAGYRANQLQLRGSSRRIFSCVFWACFAVDFLTCLASFDRTNLMPLLAGTTLIYLFFATRAANMRLGKLFATGFGSAFAIVGAFLAVQFARGASRIDVFITSMLGYTIVSYNRMAALILGAMHYQFEGKGAYVVAFFLQNDRFSGVRGELGLPNSYGLWLSEFPSLTAAGLNSSYNWASVFGYVFSDLGWWTPLYLFAAGILAGYLWSRFRAGTPLGIVFYPWMAFWILFWFGWNLLFDARGVVLLETAVLLVVYDRLSLRRARGAAQPIRVAPNSLWGAITPVATRREGSL